MNGLALTVAILILLGFVGSTGFVLLYAIHPMTRLTWWRRPAGRYLFAFTAVMMLLYSQGIINLWFPTWQHKDVARVFLAASSTVVLWSGLVLLITQTRKWKNRRDHVQQEVLAGDDRASDEDDGPEPDRLVGDR